MTEYRMNGSAMRMRREQADGCCCCITTALPEDPVAAMAYVPFQLCNDVYPCDKALCAGTIFPVLDKPFLAGCCK